VVVAVLVGAISLLIALAAGAAVVVDAWRHPRIRLETAAAKGSVAGSLAPSDPILSWTIGILTACLIYFQLRVPTGGGEFTINAADPLAVTALFFAAVFAATDRFLRLFPRPVLWGVGAIAAALTLGVVVAWLGPGLSKWAVVNRMVGLPVLVGYAATPGLVVMVAGERGRAILVDTFIAAAVVICAVQLIALGIHSFVAPLPPDFFGATFAINDQLEGYAQNPNAFAFQLLMPLAVMLGWQPQVVAGRIPPWRIVGVALLLAAVVATRSRAGIVCAVGALVFAAALHAVPPRVLLARRTIVIGLIAGAALVALGIAFSGSLGRLMEASLGPGWRTMTVESDALRWESDLLGWQAWLRHPVLGGGLGSFLLERERAGLPALVIHSVPIWFMAEMGLVGLVAWLVFVGGIAWVGFAALARDAPHARSLLVVVAVFVVMSLVHDLLFQRPFWFVAGLLVVEAAALARPSAPAPEVAASGGRS
jgi:O-antigen ligase